ncbi:MAG: hypothetical protein Q8Q06_03690 [bacterium]|nr:hypothetical protein [bacterium]
MGNTVFVIYGYGCHLTPELKKYLNRMALVANTIKPRVIMFCGGFTQRKTAPGMSEARLMAMYLMPMLKFEHILTLEEDSYITLDNTKRAYAEIKTLPFKYDNIIVGCEATRALKVDMLTKHYFGHRVNIETSSWELMNPWKQLLSTVYEGLAMYLPSLAWYFRRKRIQRAKEI